LNGEQLKTEWLCCDVSLCNKIRYVKDVAMLKRKKMDPEEQERIKMVENQIMARGITNQYVLDAMREVPRHLFVSSIYRDTAYRDQPLPSWCGQTISQPYIVALMTELLDPKPTHKVLEIGTGTGYQTAILAKLAGEVFTMEIFPELHERAKKKLEELGYQHVHFILGNGFQGFPEAAPFDLIMVTAAAPFVPEALFEQLSKGGRMAIPVGRDYQELYLITKDEQGSLTQKPILPVVFVPMQSENRL